jgi:hypothetical protein
LENQKGRDHLEDLGVGGKIILEWILGEKSGLVWAGFIWLRIETNGGNEPMSSIKCGEFLGQLSDY